MFTYRPAVVVRLRQDKSCAEVVVMESELGANPATLLVPLRQFTFGCEVFSGIIYASPVRPNKTEALLEGSNIVVVVEDKEVLGWGTTEGLRRATAWVDVPPAERAQRMRVPWPDEFDDGPS